MLPKQSVLVLVINMEKTQKNSAFFYWNYLTSLCRYAKIIGITSFVDCKKNDFKYFETDLMIELREGIIWFHTNVQKMLAI